LCYYLGVTEKTYTIDEVAEIMHCSDWLIRKAIDRGELKALHIGPRSYRITQEQFDDWKRKRETKP
jgi:excisionase family DNA binding protein